MSWNALSALLVGACGAFAILAFNQSALGAALIASAALMLILRIGLVMLIVRIIIPIAAAIGAAYLHHFVQGLPLIAPLQSAFVQSNSQAPLLVEIFSGTVSTIYALLVAFMVFNAMQDYNDINASLEKEAMHLDSVSQILPLMLDGISSNQDAVRGLHAQLRKYADNVLSKSFTKEGKMIENQAVIDSIFNQVYCLKVEDENDRIALSALLKRVDELEGLRAHRISAMKSRPSPFLIILLIFLSVMVVAPFYLPIPGGETLSLYAIGLGTFCTTFLFVMLLDMSSHFHGYWVVDREPFRAVRDRISERLSALEGDSAANAAPRAA